MSTTLQHSERRHKRFVRIFFGPLLPLELGDAPLARHRRGLKVGDSITQDVDAVMGGSEELVVAARVQQPTYALRAAGLAVTVVVVNYETLRLRTLATDGATATLQL
jgi:hypothetical protein